MRPQATDAVGTSPGTDCRLPSHAEQRQPIADRARDQLLWGAAVDFVWAGQLDKEITREVGESIEIQTHRTLLPVLKKLRAEG